MKVTIPPPFPIPSQWRSIRKVQEESATALWLVPTREYLPDLMPASPTPIASDYDESDHIFTCENPERLKINNYDEVAEKEEEEEVYESLELSQEWTARFSKTLKRLHKNQIKSNKRKLWKKAR